MVINALKKDKAGGQDMEIWEGFAFLRMMDMEDLLELVIIEEDWKEIRTRDMRKSHGRASQEKVATVLSL